MRELALHILDLAQNSLAAGATRIRLEVRLEMSANRMTLAAEDNGCGMSRETMARVADPFYTSRTTRQVGLGLPLIKAAAERCGGWLKIESEINVGTTIRIQFELDNIDRAPLGDLAGTILGLIACNPALDLEVQASWEGGEYDFSTAACREILGPDVSLVEPGVLNFLRQHLTEGLAHLKHLDETVAAMQWRKP